MMKTILDDQRKALVARIRKSLISALKTLSGAGISDDARRRLEESIHQIDALFLLVVVGEFNAGKSALINALLGTDLLAEGVTPTTSGIQLIGYSPEPTRRSIGDAIEEIGLPIELLTDLRIVDTPGTNALDRRHEAITVDFVPRSDLVVFLTSADRPFSESERVFLEKLRDWGKKILIVINKKDILQDAANVREVEEYVSSQSFRLLGIRPQIFAVSARDACRAHNNGDQALLVESGLPEFENTLRTHLESAERFRLKLLNPIGVASRLIETALETVSRQEEFLREDMQTLADIEAQLAVYRQDISREFTLRLAEMDNSLARMEIRGIEFFDSTIRLGRLPDLIRGEKIRKEYTEKVVAGTPDEIEKQVISLIDWLVDSGLRQWHAVVEHVRRREDRHPGRIVGQVGGELESGRSRLLESIGRAARESLTEYDRKEETQRMVDEVQLAVAGTALVEVGAVGLGATVAFVASSAAADVTGLLAAGVMAALGLVIMPTQRRRAKKALKQRIGKTREQLMKAMTARFEHEADAGLRRIKEVIAPYSRFIRSQDEELKEKIAALSEIREELAARRQEIEKT